MDEQTCAHAPCRCPAEIGSDYCSRQCEKSAHTDETDCNCGHPDCRAEALSFWRSKEMPRIREEYDADLIKGNEPTEYETATNRFELPCGVCGRLLYVDRTTLDAYEKAMKQDLDNQFICPACEREYEDAAFE